jgi:hypothetical protein
MANPSLEPLSDEWLIDFWASESLAILQNNLQDYYSVTKDPKLNDAAEIDLQKVMTHEIAHAHGLAGIESLMEPYYPQLEIMNTMHPDPEIEVLVQWQILSL